MMVRLIKCQQPSDSKTVFTNYCYLDGNMTYNLQIELQKQIYCIIIEDGNDILLINNDIRIRVIEQKNKLKVDFLNIKTYSNIQKQFYNQLCELKSIENGK